MRDGRRAAGPLLVGALTVSLLAAAGATITADAVTGGTSATTAGGSADAELVGLAAIAGAGLEVRHVMRVDGPDPTVTLSPDPTPSPTPTPAAHDRATGRRAGTIRAAWHSGASGDAAVDGSFGSWRGEPLQIMGTWSDTSAQEQRDVTSLDKFSGWNGDIDVALGALAPGETWAQAASGAYVDRWTTAVRNVRAKRAGHAGTVYIRFAHEMTGTWFDWKVGAGDVADFKTSWRLFHDILQREYPQAKLVFSPNDGNQSGVPLDQIYPGDDLVDVVGPHTYDADPVRSSQAVWDSSLDSTNNGPQGVGAWLTFAKAHHKPLAFPEWGLNKVDDPFYIQKMHDFLSACAARPGDTDLSGKCIYDIYFNIANSGNSGFMIYNGPNPNAAQTYRSLVWGIR